MNTATATPRAHSEEAHEDAIRRSIAAIKSSGDPARIRWITRIEHQIRRSTGG